MRRTFIKKGALGAALGLVSSPVFATTSHYELEVIPNFTSDGLGLSPLEYSQLLVEITKKQAIKADVYGMGGNIHAFEEKVAATLGKEKAIYMPTGTLANHIALRQHCTKRKKILIQQQSHIYRDSGDALSHLSGIHLLPLGTDEVSFSLAAVEKSIQDASVEKVHTGIEAISIETPVRRQHLQRFGFEKMEKISHYARENNIAMHLDGARIFGEAAIMGKDVRVYTALFDTVYISLYKYFNSIAGAMLAGPAELIDGLHNDRRMFGGGLRSAWENVVVADFFFDGFPKRFQEAQKIGKGLLDKLKATRLYDYRRYENGTNVYLLTLTEGNPDKLQKNLLEYGVLFPTYNAKEKGFVIKLNESLIGLEVDEMVNLFVKGR